MDENSKVTNKRQMDIIKLLDSNGHYDDWFDWKWHIKHIIKDMDVFGDILGIRFNEQQRQEFGKIVAKFPFAVTPYYASLIDLSHPEDDPMFKHAFPSFRELDVSQHDKKDPLQEERDSPVSGITYRYPDRVMFFISSRCALYCRHCLRKRKVGDPAMMPDKKAIAGGIEYIKKTPQIRDVLVSGGDPLLISEKNLEWILEELRNIDHVEIIRIGTRIPTVLPFRITDKLVAILKRFHPLWISTHFNHPREITAAASQALAKLADAGLPLINQTVLLAGVNDCPRIIRSLVHKLVRNRVRPYYLFQCDPVEGVSHFRTPVGKGIEIMESLIGHTSGLCVPRYAIDVPGGGGKVPVIPNYLISWSPRRVVLRNYEGLITAYDEPSSYNETICTMQCESCVMHLSSEDADNMELKGVEKLLAETEKSISLVPRERQDE